MSLPRASERIVAHYEACLARHGDSHLGVDWPKAEDVDTRHRVMLDVIRSPRPDRPIRLLDVGCGASHLLEWLQQTGVADIEYSGLDLSPRFVELSRRKFPGVRYWCQDLLDPGAEPLPRFDYAVLSGVFTEKLDVPYDEMLALMQATVASAFALVDVGLAFNVMSKHVDWERDDLFHLPFDELAAWLTREVSRDFVIRSDYGLYEYTTYVYRRDG